MAAWRESTEEVQRTRAASRRLHIDKAKQNIIMAAPSPAGPTEGESAPAPMSTSDMPDLDDPAAA